MSNLICQKRIEKFEEVKLLLGESVNSIDQLTDEQLYR